MTPSLSPSLWLTLFSCVGMSLLAVRVVRTRHELAPPLALFIADLLVWNLAWLAHELSQDIRWDALARGAGAFVPGLGIELVLRFVGKRKELRWLRRGAYLWSAALAFVAGSRAFVGDLIYPSDLAWRVVTVSGLTLGVVTVAWLLHRHARDQHDPAERGHTRILMLGLSLWTALACTDVIHQRLGAVPRMSGVGMLVAALLTAVVLERLRPDGDARRSALHVAGLGLAAALAHALLLSTLPLQTAMALGRTLLLSVVALAAVRELSVMLAQRRARVARLALLGRVTAQMAHDLKNPLAALKGAVQVVSEDRRRGLPPNQQLLLLVEEQVDRLAAIIDGYGRTASIEPRPEVVELVPLVRALAKPPGLRLRLSLEAERCLCDRQLLARVLENLLRNAAEAMPAGGEVCLVARASGPRWIELSVSDEGPGMDARTREHAFDDFFTTKQQGSGLGLSFVQRVVEAHGGAAWIDSDVGHGTRVCLRLPAVADPAPVLELTTPIIDWR